MHGFPAGAHFGFAVLIAGSFGCSKSEPPEAPPAAPSVTESPSAATAPPADTGQTAPEATAEVKYSADQCDAYLAANHQANANTDAKCLGTELTLLAKDPTGDCLGCFFQSGCLDDTNGDTGQECEDLKGSAAQAQCLAVLQCGVCSSPASSPAPAAGLVANAYCGVGVRLSKCTQEGPQGKCASPIAAGFPAGFTPTQIMGHLADRSHPAGVANAIMACGVSAARTKAGAGCNKCFQ